MENVVYMSEESCFEELLANHLNNSRGDFAGYCRKLLDLGLYCSKGYFFFHGRFNKFKMCMTPVARGTLHHLVRLGRLLPAHCGRIPES